MSKGKARPVALTVAGSDSGGGAGVQADLKTFAALGVHGVSALTAVTAQNPGRVFRVWPVPPKIVAAQIEAVLDFFRPAAVKTGMLWSRNIIEAAARPLARARIPLVIDPVLISTSGRRLLARDAETALERTLIPLAILVTPNVPEAATFLRREITSLEQARQAARDLQQKWGTAVLVKGGHLETGREAADFFCDGRQELMICGPRIRVVATHGTGCVYASAIAAGIASGLALTEAIRAARGFVAGAILGSHRAGRATVLHFGA